MSEKPTSRISAYHAHVYFDADTVDQARSFCEQAASLFRLDMGRMHKRPVGPHPRWSCQLAFKASEFDKIVPWLALNRDGLTIFTHPETGNAVEDHRDHAIWMGELLPLDLSVLE